MTIENVAYNPFGLLIITWSDGEITVTADNPDSQVRQSVADWEAEGNTIAPAADLEPTVPVSVTMRQAKLQMSRAGILSAVDAFIAGMEGQAGEEARIEWAYAAELRRDHPLVAALGPQFDLTDVDIDGLFVEADKIA